MCPVPILIRKPVKLSTNLLLRSPNSSFLISEVYVHNRKGKSLCSSIRTEDPLKTPISTISLENPTFLNTLPPYNKRSPQNSPNPEKPAPESLPLDNLVLNDNIFQFNFNDLNKSEDDVFNAQFEGNKDCPSILWSPKYKTFREDVSDCNRLFLESFPVTKDSHESPSPQSELSINNSLSFFNSSNLGNSDFRTSDSLKPVSFKKDILGSSNLELLIGNSSPSIFKSKNGNENVLTSLNVIPVSFVASNKENGVLAFNQQKSVADKAEIHQTRQL